MKYPFKCLLTLALKSTVWCSCFLLVSELLSIFFQLTDSPEWVSGTRCCVLLWQNRESPNTQAKFIIPTAAFGGWWYYRRRKTEEAQDKLLSIKSSQSQGMKLSPICFGCQVCVQFAHNTHVHIHNNTHRAKAKLGLNTVSGVGLFVVGNSHWSLLQFEK